MEKVEIRKAFRHRRRELPSDFVDEKSELITEKILKLIEQNDEQFDNILIYCPIENEVDILKLMSKSKHNRFYVPKICDGQMQVTKYNKKKRKKNSFGIEEIDTDEYLDPLELDLVILPGVVFGRDFTRVGFGKGYYDRYLSQIRDNVYKVGVCYDFQLVDSIKSEDFDVEVDAIITEKSTLFN